MESEQKMTARYLDHFILLLPTNEWEVYSPRGLVIGKPFKRRSAAVKFIRDRVYTQLTALRQR